MSTSSDHEQLVALVKQRTEEIQRINQQLQREINEHRLVEQALRINEEKFRDIFNSIQYLLSHDPRRDIHAREPVDLSEIGIFRRRATRQSG